MAAAALLLTDDREEADRLAAELETANRSRRDLTSQAISEARAALEGAEPGSGATIVRGPWPVGIVGLVASKLVDDHGRPAIVGAELGEVIRASCRSDGRLDLGATLERARACSCGMAVMPARPASRSKRAVGGSSSTSSALLRRGRSPPTRARSCPWTSSLPALDVDYALQRDIARLAPCGIGNPEPLLLVQGLTVTRVRAARAVTAS